MAYYSPMKRSGILIQATWMTFENMLSEKKKNPDTETYILYDSIYVKCPDLENP